MSIGRVCSSVIFTALLAIVSLPAIARTDQKEEQVRQPLLVDTNWLAERLDTPGMVIVDARSPEEYRRGHIAGAINLPSADTYHPVLKHRVVNQAEIQNVLGRQGINSDNQVILYGNATYMDAARVFWILELYGHSRVSLMNGGYPAWKNADLPTDTNVLELPAVYYHAVIRSGLMATKLQMLLAIDNPTIGILDTRKAVEYQGVESLASRSGHIPGAIDIPRIKNIGVWQGIHHIKSRPELKELYKDLDDYSEVILYCNSARESSIAYLALRLLDKEVRVYDGGWYEWGNDPYMPIVTPRR